MKIHEDMVQILPSEEQVNAINCMDFECKGISSGSVQTVLIEIFGMSKLSIGWVLRT